METPHDCDCKSRKDGDRYIGPIHTISIRADVEIIPNVNKTAEAQPDYRMMTQGIEIGAGWTKKGDTFGKKLYQHPLAAAELRPKKLYANLGRAADSDKENLYRVI